MDIRREDMWRVSPERQLPHRRRVLAEVRVFRCSPTGIIERFLGKKERSHEAIAKEITNPKLNVLCSVLIHSKTSFLASIVELYNNKNKSA